MNGLDVWWRRDPGRLSCRVYGTGGPGQTAIWSNGGQAAIVPTPGGRERIGSGIPCRSAPHRSPTEEVTITSGLKPASWSYSEGYVAEDEVLANARSRAAEVAAVPIGPGAGAALRFVASILDAKNVVEIGTGCGVSGVWMMRGMRSDGVLTSVDIEVEHQRLAKQAFDEAGIASQRVRFIPGAALRCSPA